MGIGKLYYSICAILCLSFLGKSYLKDFDGTFHRPRNQYKKAAQKKAEQDAAKKADKLADEVGSNGPKSKARKRRDGTPAPRPVNVAATSGRSGSRAPDARRSRGERGNARSASSGKHTNYDHRGSDMDGTPVKPNPFADYVPEAHVLDKHPPPGIPFRPVHSTRTHYSHLRPSDFAAEDPYNPGHSLRESNYPAFKHLFGADDDQYRSLP